MSIVPFTTPPNTLPSGNIVINIQQGNPATLSPPMVTVNGQPIYPQQQPQWQQPQLDAFSPMGRSNQAPQGPYGQPNAYNTAATVPYGTPGQAFPQPVNSQANMLAAMQPKFQQLQFAYQVAMKERHEAEVARLAYMNLANEVNQQLEAITGGPSPGQPLQGYGQHYGAPQPPMGAPYGGGYYPMAPQQQAQFFPGQQPPTPPAMVGMPGVIDHTPAPSTGSPFPNAVPASQLPTLPTDPTTPTAAPPATPAEAPVVGGAPTPPPAPVPTPAVDPNAPAATTPTATPPEQAAPTAAPATPANPANTTAPGSPTGTPQQLSDFPLYKQLSTQSTPQLQGLLRDILSIPNEQGQVNQLKDPNLYSLQTIEFVLFILRNRPDAATPDTYNLLKQLKDMGLVMATLKDPSIEDWKKKDSEVILMESLWAAAKLDSFQPPNTPLNKLQGYASMIKPILEGTENVPPLITMAAVQAISPDMFARYNEIPPATLTKLQARLSKANASSGQRKWTTLWMSKHPTLSDEEKAINTQTIQLAEMVKRGQSLSSLPGMAAPPPPVPTNGMVLPAGTTPAPTVAPMAAPQALTGAPPLTAPGPTTALPPTPGMPAGMPTLSPAEVDSLMQSLPPDQKQAIENMAKDLMADPSKLNDMLGGNGMPPVPPTAPARPIAATGNI